MSGIHLCNTAMGRQGSIFMAFYVSRSPMANSTPPPTTGLPLGYHWGTTRATHSHRYPEGNTLVSSWSFSVMVGHPRGVVSSVRHFSLFILTISFGFFYIIFIFLADYDAIWRSVFKISKQQAIEFNILIEFDNKLLI